MNPAASVLTAIVDGLSYTTGHKITKEEKYEQLVKEALGKDTNKRSVQEYCSVGRILTKARKPGDCIFILMSGR